MLTMFADWFTYTFLRLPKGRLITEAIHFFVYDIPKIYLLLVVIVFVVAMLRTWTPAEKAKRLLVHRHQFVGNVLAASLGILTPFCTCSAIPMFIGFVESGVPLGVTFSFLVASPMINEVAMVLLWGLFGAKVALLYVGVGLLIAIVSGVIIGQLHMEKYVEDYVYKIKVGAVAGDAPMTFNNRVVASWRYVGEIFRKVAPWVAVGVAIGAFIHGYAPENFLARYAGRDNPFAVLLAVAIGIPLYSNAEGVIPIVQALWAKDLPLGTTLAFMMAVTGLSMPEMIILRSVLKPRLLATFIGVVGLGILIVGYFFNWVL
ncbi:MAG: permease [Caldiserica bacterium]|nr:permease [Caldisericota bacterium]